MKTEYVYEKVVEAFNNFCAEKNLDSKEFLESPEKYIGLKTFRTTGIEPFIDLICACRYDMKKKNTAPKRIGAVKRIIKRGTKYDNKLLSGIFPVKDCYAVCDSHIFAVMEKDIETVPHIPEYVQPLDIYKLIEMAKYTCEVQPPTINDLKHLIAEGKAQGKAQGKTKKLYKIENDRYVDAELLLDLLNIIENPIMRLPDKKNGIILIVDTQGKEFAGICPVNVPDPEEI